MMDCLDASLGQLERHGDRWQLRFVRRFPHSPETLLRALTEPEQLAVWFPTDVIGERAAGADLRFVFRDGEGPPLDGKLLAYEPPRLVEYRWGDDETLRFELEPDGDGARLTFVNTFGELGKAARDGAGWHARLNELADHLDGHESPLSSIERWAEVHPLYVDLLGQEASTIGPPQDANSESSPA